MKMKAYAKVNIALDAIGKREDNYHLLRMIMQTVDLYDVIDIEKSNDSSISISCNKHYVPTDERNLAYKAAVLFRENFNIKGGVKISIKKNIPVAAGMAGGSTNAAAVLVMMNKLFKVNASLEELKELGLKIGADVPYCIEGGTALCEGIGEVITPLKPFENKILVVLKPNFGVSTKEVYTNLDINKIRKHVNIEELIEAMENDDLNYVAKNMKNVLENVTLKKHSVLKTIKEDMRRSGALGAMMSGSGPTVFAFFDDMLTAQKSFEFLKNKYKYSDVYITRTISNNNL
ncbi:4-(cytidine 5'-diphospho)-2-C-methyl-D-erythritol kinase [Clostridium sp. LIBA-8841]|uniref:4-(cytidine 5'-diphospho)-2-C-methyl-D-erythritol kinase n=1 Tax=Clostridium sp. LIBA-8841 TaxID=2987530 RepID=UPI002AC41D7A|nr:4-(cytidine 5'-diphospho)-2-C-methyl-D-erythritol kinase [Clostridium sp. LIBA-8841]MDZ5253161.1 4-(cytidine 5'-diphospho)-2-C-methyl-D-erythritol kinase [Clostridium sp. LIBA-8841]